MKRNNLNNEIYSEEIRELIKDIDNFKAKQNDLMDVIKSIYLNLSTNN